MKKINELFGFKTTLSPSVDNPEEIISIAVAATTEGAARRKARKTLREKYPHTHIVLKRIELKFQKVESDATG